ncbi:MAG: hypothetical protein IT198_04595 [Acidimicrobiia bacterium]|nr:hypothetical protein [Acidimicrobiia bacterium]
MGGSRGSHTARALRVGAWCAFVVCLAVLAFGAEAHAQAEAAAQPDHVTLELKPAGGPRSAWTGDVTDGDLAVTDDAFDTRPARITGEAAVPGADTTARVSVDVTRVPFFPLALGSVHVEVSSQRYAAAVVAPLKETSAGAVEVTALALAGRPLPAPVTVVLRVTDRSRTPGDHTVRIFHNGLRRFAVVHVPPAGSGPERLPLVLNLHGYLERHWMVDLFGETSAHADANGYIVAYPQSTGLRWQDAAPSVDDVGYLTALIDEMVDRFGADPARVYVTGLSNGGFFTHVLACDLADRVAAAVSVVGYLPDTRPCEPGRPLPMTILNGTADPLVSHLEGRAAAARWAELNGCDPADPTITQLADVFPGDGTTVERWDRTGCDAPVVYFEVRGGGPLWYGHAPFLPPPTLGGQTYDIDVNDVIWDFVSQFTLP